MQTYNALQPPHSNNNSHLIISFSACKPSKLYLIGFFNDAPFVFEFQIFRIASASGAFCRKASFPHQSNAFQKIRSSIVNEYCIYIDRPCTQAIVCLFAVSLSLVLVSSFLKPPATPVERVRTLLMGTAALISDPPFAASFSTALAYSVRMSVQTRLKF